MAPVTPVTPVVPVVPVVPVRWNAHAPWISQTVRLKITKKARKLQILNDNVKLLSKARNHNPSDLHIASKHDKAVIMTQDLFTDVRNIFLTAIVEAFESSDTGPIQLWVEG